MPGCNEARHVRSAVGATITEVWNLLVSGRLKVVASLTNRFREFRKYHRDDKGSGKIVTRDDHLMDATRYLISSGCTRMHTQPQPPGHPPGLLAAVRCGCKAAHLNLKGSGKLLNGDHLTELVNRRQWRPRIEHAR